jgi:SAM-dependent methyltransferase
MDARAHWEAVYGGKQPTEVSWYQAEPRLSLDLIRRAAPRHAASIIDVGGGASTLVDWLLMEGYLDITVLDISPTALREASERLGPRAARVTWLDGNVLDARLPPAAYDVWHDRAVFHFLTDAGDRQSYVDQVCRSVRSGGYVIIATFADDGPRRCSGLEVARYTPEGLHGQFGPAFELVDSIREEHRTPAGGVQPFTYCLCRRRPAMAT